MIDFSKVKEITIPEGNVKEITNADGVVLWSGSRLPSAYQEAEYIRAESGVGAYIDLGFAFDTKARILMSQWITDNTNAYPFGATENSGILRCCLSSPYGSKHYFYGSDGETFVSVQSQYVLNAENHLSMILEKGNLYLCNSTASTSAQYAEQAEYTMTSNLYLFAQNYNGSPRWGGVRQIGYFKYYDKTDTLICDLVPCYRKSDGEAGMYDLVQKKFYTNAGSGAFTAGADV